MFTDRILQGWRKSKRNVCDVARHFMIIPVIPNEESIARMSVQINRQSRKRLGSVDIVELLSLLIHRLLIFAVLWHAGRHDQRLQIGRYPKKYSANARSVEQNFTENYLILKLVVANSVLVNVELILRNLMIVLNRVFVVRASGCKREKELSYGTMRLVRNVVLRENTFMSIIRNLNEMVERRGMKILQPYAHIATG